MFQASQVVQDFFHPHEVAETPWLEYDCDLFLDGWKSGEVFWPGTAGYLGPKLFNAFPNSHFDCEQESLYFPLCFEGVRWKSLDPLIFGKYRFLESQCFITSTAPLVWPRFGPLAEVLQSPTKQSCGWIRSYSVLSQKIIPPCFWGVISISGWFNVD